MFVYNRSNSSLLSRAVTVLSPAQSLQEITLYITFSLLKKGQVVNQVVIYFSVATSVVSRLLTHHTPIHVLFILLSLCCRAFIIQCVLIVLLLAYLRWNLSNLHYILSGELSSPGIWSVFYCMLHQGLGEHHFVLRYIYILYRKKNYTL